MLTNNNGNGNYNNGGYNTNNNQQGETREKTSFKISKQRGMDGEIEIGLWKSKAGYLYITMLIRQQIGVDPNGRSSFEADLAKNIPSAMLSADKARAIFDLYRNDSMIGVDETIKTNDKDPNSSLRIIGSDKDVKVIITDPKGSRTLTFQATPCGSKNVHATWHNVLDLIAFGVRKALFVRTSDELLGNGEELPFDA